MRVSRFVAALSVTGAFLLGVSAPAYSAPLTPLSISAKPAQADSAVQVRFGGFHGGGFGGFRGGGFGGWHGGGWHRGFGWGGVGALAAGAVIGGALAAPYYYGGDPYYGYDDAYYGSGYGYPGYSTVVVTPGYGYYGYPYGPRPYGYYGGGW
jgi:hypothetical protein